MTEQLHVEAGTGAEARGPASANGPRRGPDPEPAPVPTRWLDAEEQRTWRTYLVATRLLFEELERDLQRQAVTLGYYEILVRLSEAPGRALRMSELAEHSQSSRSRLSHAVDRMETDGLIRRETCATDRRGTVAVLTDEGLALLEATAPHHVHSVRAHLFDLLDTEQLGQLRTICEVIVGHLRALGRSCAIEIPGYPEPDRA